MKDMDIISPDQVLDPALRGRIIEIGSDVRGRGEVEQPCANQLTKPYTVCPVSSTMEPPSSPLQTEVPGEHPVEYTSYSW